MGAKQGRTKGNKQKAKYSESDGKHGKPGWKKEERKKQRLSSEMLKRKWTKESGSQAPAPEGKTKRGSPVEQLRERSRAGRKETNRKLSTKTGRERMGNQPGRNGESKEAKAERQHQGSH